MAVLQMQRVSICALKKDRKSILEKLQSMGILEISQVADEDDAFSRMDTMNARVSFEPPCHTAQAIRASPQGALQTDHDPAVLRSEEHTSELQSH